MTPARLTGPRAAAGLLAAMGVLLLAPWLLGLDLIGPLIPGARQAGVLNPLLFIGIACCLLDASVDHARAWLHRLAVAFMAALVLLPGAHLVESFAGVSLGVDFALPGQVATAANPNPGRISPNASAAFMSCGFAFWLLGQPWTRVRGALFVVFTVLAAGIGLSGLLGYLLGLERLYKLASFNRMLPATAFGFAIAGLSLWTFHESYGPSDRRVFDQIGRRIDRRFVAVLTLAAVSGGVAGFSLMRDTFEASVADDMLLTASTHEAALGNALEASLWFPKLIATRPTVRQSLATLDRDPGNQAARSQLQNIADSFPHAQLSAARFYDSQGRLVVTTGQAATQVRVVHPLRGTAQNAQLAWDDGYLLQVSNPVTVDDKPVGRIETEQRLLPVDRLLAKLRASSASLDAAICSRDAARVVCAPTKQRLEPFTMPLDAATDTAPYTMLRAIRGERGVAFARDPRGINVISAFLPIGDYGLGFGVKSDVDALYAPLRSRLQWLGLALVGVVWLGVAAQRSQVRPVLDQLVASERRLKAILDEQIELVSLSRPDGTLSYVNPSYARYFGRSVEAMTGTSLYDYVKPDDRDAVARHLDDVFASGRESSTENRMVSATQGEGWVAWSNSLQRDPSGQLLLRSIGRDVTQRREAETALTASRELLLRQTATLRSVTEAIPAIVAVVDADLRYRFVNSAFERWIGKSRDDIIGSSIEQVMGAEDYALILPWARRALAGETVQFERSYPQRRTARHLSLHYIPNWNADAVDGFVGVAQDITEQREEAVRLLDLTRRDPLTRLLNRAGLEDFHRCRVKDVDTAPLALLYIDLDHFKPVNDRYGHAVGDQVLRLFAGRVQDSVRPTDGVARLGGDEFAVLLVGVRELANAKAVADKIIVAAHLPFVIEALELGIGASVGVAMAEAEGESWDELVRRADALLYSAKSEGRGRSA